MLVVAGPGEYYSAVESVVVAQVLAELVVEPEKEGITIKIPISANPSNHPLP